MSLLFEFMCMRLPFFHRTFAGVSSSQALSDLLITAPPPVFVPSVLGVLTVWFENQKKIRCITRRPGVGKI